MFRKAPSGAFFYFYLFQIFFLTRNLNVCTFAVHTYIMKRLHFIKTCLLGVFSTHEVSRALQAKEINKESGNTKSNNTMKKAIIHKAATRGQANHGWLNSFHTFSFANYHNPERMHFGVLRVLNDDTIEGGTGFGTHPHNNMEIISIPLRGDLEHKDSLGSTQVIRSHDIQVMSAGSGVTHSEYNHSKTETTNFLQIWVFPKVKNVQPRYDQLHIDPSTYQNQFKQILSPNPDDDGVWIHQDAWFHRGFFEQGKTAIYQVKKPENGLYLFVLEGQVQIQGIDLDKRDGIGLEDVSSLDLKALSDTEVLLMEVPMTL